MTDLRTVARPLLELQGVRKIYSLPRILPWLPPRATIRAVDGVSLEIRPHETLGLVGESGCGKTTTARLILRLEVPTEGRILFQGADVSTLTGHKLRAYRASLQAVFQDPWSSLNPRQRVKDIIAEPLIAVAALKGKPLSTRVDELLIAVGLEPSLGSSFPHELSGGMRQRVAVARALAPHPSIIVLDEPLSSLDVSIQAQIMNLLRDLQDRFRMAYLLIAHNLATVRYLSHRVAVIHMGEIVELADSESLFTSPLHPYTQALISAAVPFRPGDTRPEIVLDAEVPSATNPPPGCRFHTRCPFAFSKCSTEIPKLQETSPGHQVACHLY